MMPIQNAAPSTDDADGAASDSPLPDHQQAQLAHKRKKTHRGGKKRGDKSATAHHADAKEHIKNAADASDPNTARTHLFRALTSLKKATPTV